ncbi:DUF11 domain-containing protein [Methylotetracoccus oryzae]|uniref:DUF11 domain-containing protein n=1 Tax=Methylotetracoccus oryzae TaxID=1919059 RepID=UPI001117BFCB|nr:DUF11 domain-containing protein [Methylotetracoccus oryzae]
MDSITFSRAPSVSDRPAVRQPSAHHSHPRHPLPSLSSQPPAAATGRYIGLMLTPLLLVAAASATASGETTRISERSGSSVGLSSYERPGVSADGRYVAFASRSSDAVGGDTNGVSDVFVRDRATRRTIRISVGSDGRQTDAMSDAPSLSANGRFIAFRSSAGNLVPSDTNGAADVFVHDLKTGETTRASIDSSGTQGDLSSGPEIALSADGRFIAFSSAASNLVPGDTNGERDFFVHDRNTRETKRINVDSRGRQSALAYSDNGLAISADGRFVAFTSSANALVSGDTNDKADVFVHDRQTQETTRVSVDSAGAEQNGSVLRGIDLSADGRYVAFSSGADNLVPNDTNRVYDIFVHDRSNGMTTLASVRSGTALPFANALEPRLSADGRFVAFGSLDPNFASDDANRAGDVFVYDRLTRQTQRISSNPDGVAGDAGSFVPASISADGRFVAFTSDASDLIDRDTNGATDIFVRDRLVDRTAMADLAITQTVSPSAFEPLAPVTYTVTAVNHGPDPATEVALVDRPPLLSASVSSATPSQGHCSQGTPLVCYFGVLAPGAEATVTLTLQPRWQGTPSLSNTASISASPVDPDNGNNRSAVRVDAASQATTTR